MTYKTILVHVEPGPGSDARLELAVEVAAQFDAMVIGLGAQAFYPVFSSGYAAADGAVIEAMRGRIIADLPIAEKRFREATSGVKGGVRWISGMDYPARELALHGRSADLIIASRPEKHASSSYAPTPADVVMEAGGPVLFAADPAKPLNASRIVVGWKDTRESRRALADALPLMRRAEEVVIVEIEGDLKPVAERGGLGEIAGRLERHGIKARTETVARSRATIADDLEHAATRHGADVIVTGAYGHARLREWILGGVTEDLLASSSKCVLFSH
ncbi:MAG: universal stress protein [Caulobacteraceae bacterium]|nr:universal stress protein [Caulobacteraceae bacterium]